MSLTVFVLLLLLTANYSIVESFTHTYNKISCLRTLRSKAYKSNIIVSIKKIYEDMEFEDIISSMYESLPIGPLSNGLTREMLQKKLKDSPQMLEVLNDPKVQRMMAVSIHPSMCLSIHTHTYFYTVSITYACMYMCTDSNIHTYTRTCILHLRLVACHAGWSWSVEWVYGRPRFNESYYQTRESLDRTVWLALVLTLYLYA